MITDYVYWVRGNKHAEMAELSIASVHKADRLATAFVYTDEPDLVIPGAKMVRMTEPEPAMVANLTAQRTHLATAPYGRHVVLLDADVLVRKPFEFDSHSQLYVTWRDHVARSDKVKLGDDVARWMPYNYGVIGAVACAPVIEAFTWLRARILNMAAQYQHWYGNQLALFELCGAPGRGVTEKIPVAWSSADSAPRLNLKRLECEIWNYTPEKPGEDVTEKAMLHFKGGRKDMMEAYA